MVSRESFLTFLRLLQFNNSMDAFLYAVRSSPRSVLSEGLPLHHRLPHHHQWMQMPTRFVASSPSFALPSVPFIHLMWQRTPRPQPTALLGLDSRSKAVISLLPMRCSSCIAGCRRSTIRRRHRRLRRRSFWGDNKYACSLVRSPSSLQRLSSFLAPSLLRPSLPLPQVPNDGIS